MLCVLLCLNFISESTGKKLISKNKITKNPLTTRIFLEDTANGFQVLQGITWLFSAMIALGSLQLKSDLKETQTPNPQPTNPSTVIIINNHRSEDDLNLKLQQAQNQLDKINQSEDKDTLSKAKEAIADLQKLLTEKKAELEQGKHQLNSLNAQNLSEEELQWKKHFDRHLNDTQNEIEKLNNLNKRIEASQEAIDWLESRKGNFLENLAKISGDVALDSHSIMSNRISQQNLQQFYSDIEDFLRYIRICLIVCRPNLIDEVIDEGELPESSLPASFYITTFEFIRDDIVPSSISRQVAREELTAYLDYLINKFS